MATTTAGSSCLTTQKCFEKCPCLERVVETPPHRFWHCCPLPPMSLDFYTQSSWTPCLVIWLGAMFMLYAIIPLLFFHSFFFGISLRTCREIALIEPTCLYDAQGSYMGVVQQNSYAGNWGLYNFAELGQLPLSAIGISIYHSPFWLAPAIALQTWTAVNFQRSASFCPVVTAGLCVYADKTPVYSNFTVGYTTLAPWANDFCVYYAAEQCYSMAQINKLMKASQIVDLQYSESYVVFLWGRVLMSSCAFVYFLYGRFKCSFIPTDGPYAEFLVRCFSRMQREFRLSSRLWVAHTIMLFFMTILGKLLFEVVVYILMMFVSGLLPALHVPKWVTGIVSALANLQGTVLLYVVLRSATKLHFQYRRDVAHVYDFVQKTPAETANAVEAQEQMELTLEPLVDETALSGETSRMLSDAPGDAVELQAIEREADSPPSADGDGIVETNPWVERCGRVMNILFPHKREPNPTIVEDIDHVSMITSYQWPIIYPLSMVIGVCCVTAILLLVEIPVIVILVIYLIPTIPPQVKAYVTPIIVKGISVLSSFLVVYMIALAMKIFHCIFFRNETTLKTLRRQKIDFLWVLSLVDTWVVIFVAPFIGVLVIAKAKLTMLGTLFFKSFFRVYQPNMPVPDQLSDAVYRVYVSVVACGVFARLKETGHDRLLGDPWDANALSSNTGLPLQ